MMAAMSLDRVIGRKGALPWHMPADLKRFKRRTMGHAVIMGRKTWQTMNQPLPGRLNIVISRDAAFRADGALIAPGLEAALRIARERQPADEETFVIGGAEIFTLTLPLADRIDLAVIETRIDDGDAFFPEFETDESWRLISEETHAADDRNAYACAFRMYERRR